MVVSGMKQLDLACCLRWFARLWAAGLWLFWGAFFVEHVIEWLVQADRWPPVSVLTALAVHLSLLLGLLIGWRWEVTGGLLTLVATALFLPGRTIPTAAPYLVLATLVPAAIWLALGGYELGRRLARPAIAMA